MDPRGAIVKLLGREGTLRRLARSVRPLAWVVVGVGMLGSAGVALSWSQGHADETATRLEESLGRAGGAVDTELQRYEDLLRAIYASFPAERLTQAELDRYVETLDLGRRYTGLQGVAVIEPERRRGADTPASIVRYTAPAAGWVSRGFDLGSVPQARTALESARDSGRAMLSARWRADDPQLPAAGRREGNALFVPFYGSDAESVDGRRRDLQGWLAVRFRADRFLDRVLQSGDPNLRLTLFYGRLPAPPEPVGTSSGSRGGEAVLTRERQLESYGRHLVLRAEALPGFGPESKEPLLVLVLGSALTLLLAAFVQELSRAEQRARRLADTSVGALLDFEDRFRSLAATPVGIFRIDGTGLITYVNERFEEIVHRNLRELKNKHWTELVHADDARDAQRAWRDAYDAETELTREFRLGGSDEECWVACRLAPLPSKGWVGSLEDVSERRRAEAELKHRASRDPLTELPNRRLFMERLANALTRAERRGNRVGVLFLDLDEFKEINDSHGHEAGDRVLVAVSRRLVGAMRSGDTVARYGGDEFAVLCDRLEDAEEAAAAARRVSNALEEPFTIEGSSVRVTPSVGIAIGPGPGITPETLLRAADQAMYRAKSGGTTFELSDAPRW